MRFSEVETGSDAAQYIFEVYNPLGYAGFILDSDRDYLEKAEHMAIASFTIAFPFHFFTAISTGGYWANLPPGTFYRGLAMKKFTQDMMYAVVRKTATVAARFVAPAALVAPMVIGYEANRRVIETMPQHEQQPFWASIGQALAGTGFGVGGSKSGIIP